MALIQKLGYECESCGKFTPADTEFTDDMPEGYYVNIRRVTEKKNHRVSDGAIYVCDKECLINFFQYGITHATQESRPIGRKERR